MVAQRSADCEADDEVQRHEHQSGGDCVVENHEWEVTKAHSAIMTSTTLCASRQWHTGRMEIRRATVDDWEASRDIRLRALAESPDAFLSTLEREAAFDDEVWMSRLEGSA